MVAPTQGQDPEQTLLVDWYRRPLGPRATSCLSCSTAHGYSPTCDSWLGLPSERMLCPRTSPGKHPERKYLLPPRPFQGQGPKYVTPRPMPLVKR